MKIGGGCGGCGRDRQREREREKEGTKVEEGRTNGCRPMVRPLQVSLVEKGTSDSQTQGAGGSADMAGSINFSRTGGGEGFKKRKETDREENKKEIKSRRSGESK